MMLLEHTGTIQRNTAVGTNGRQQLADLYTDVPCLVLPMSLSTAVSNGFSLGKAFDVFFAEGQDVKPGDKVVVSAGNEFLVKGVQPFNVPNVAHVRALCTMEAS